MAGVDLRTRQAVRDLFHATLAAAMTERRLRDDPVGTDDGPELGWVVYERALMHDLVIRVRAERGLPAVDLSEVLRIERQAEGHSDYHAKFALYCAELALGEKRTVW